MLKKIGIIITAVLCIFVGATTATTAEAEARGKDCGSIIFTPNSDDMAGSIRAKNVSCKKARSIVRQWKGGTRVQGFRVTYRVVNQGLNHTNVRARKGKALITWARY